MLTSNIFPEIYQLLKDLIATPSLSRQESDTAALIGKFFSLKNIEHSRVGNNVFALNKYFDATKPVILLNSHHDTVKPSPAYTRNPFSPEEADGRLYGLGSNDAGGCLAALAGAFLYFYEQQNFNYNIIFAATAEEEISGTGGIEMTLPFLPEISCAIVGEPTQMNMAVAERGLMVLDAEATGITGHAARNEGTNAIGIAVKDINWFNSYAFEKVSPLLGPVKMNVTVIETENKLHNVVPASCKFVVDVRVNELYSFEEVLNKIRQHISSTVIPRSTRLRSTNIEAEHALVKAGLALGKTCYGSPTTSDKALMPFPALKMGPGDSARSHTADEFIYIDEIKQGLEDYVQLLTQII